MHIFLIARVEHQDERYEQKEKGNPGKKKSPQVPGANVEVLKRFNSVIAILYISIKETLLISGGGFPRTPPKLEGLGE